MNTHVFPFKFILLLLILNQTNEVLSQTSIPKPDHVVIVILENHRFEDIVRSTAAPYINSLVNDNSSALFTASYGVTHPSQPNYLTLYSGNTQGVTDDLIPSDNPFTTENIGRQLIDDGQTFITYSEGLPQVGYNGETSGSYARKHNPVANWMGNGTNQISTTTNQPFTAFPSSNFASLPTVCFVIPNTANDMHDGVDPGTITTGDKWISNHMDKYIQWAKSNNSLFILTFDEDNVTSPSNHITTIFTGQRVQSGKYSTRVNHYTILHTIERMYGLAYIGDSVTYAPIDYCWKKTTSTDSISNGLIYPSPANDFIYIELSDYLNADAEIYNLNGKLIKVNPLMSEKTEVKTDALTSGLYLVKIRNKAGVIVKRFIKK